MISINEILGRVKTIPPLPGTILRLVNTVNDPASTVQDIVKVIQYDTGLTAEMLRLCNSAYFGLVRQVTSLHDAIRYLGTLRVLQMVMSVQGTALLTQAQHGYGMEPGDLWVHSVGVALASTAFGRRTKQSNEGLLFTAGLLHDIGKVILNEFVAAEFAAIVNKVEQEGASFCEAEQQVLGFSHDEIGAELAERWDLPETITKCIRHHHNPSALNPPEPAVDMVHLGELACTMLGLSRGHDGLSYRAHEEVINRYNLHESDFERIGIEITVEVARVRQMFSESDRPSKPKTLEPVSVEV